MVASVLEINIEKIQNDAEIYMLVIFFFINIVSVKMKLHPPEPSQVVWENL